MLVHQAEGGGGYEAGHLGPHRLGQRYQGRLLEAGGHGQESFAEALDPGLAQSAPAEHGVPGQEAEEVGGPEDAVAHQRPGQVHQARSRQQRPIEVEDGRSSSLVGLLRQLRRHGEHGIGRHLLSVGPPRCAGVAGARTSAEATVRPTSAVRADQARPPRGGGLGTAGGAGDER